MRLQFVPFIDGLEKDSEALFELYKLSPDYFLSVKGRLPVLQDAIDSLVSYPSSGDHLDKTIGGFWYNGELIGCADYVFGYPNRNTLYLGLLLFTERWIGQGFGARALSQIYDIAMKGGCSVVRLSVVDVNVKALDFWRHIGFNEVGRVQVEGYISSVVIMERLI